MWKIYFWDRCWRYEEVTVRSILATEKVISAIIHAIPSYKFNSVIMVEVRGQGGGLLERKVWSENNYHWTSETNAKTNNQVRTEYGYNQPNLRLVP